MPATKKLAVVEEEDGKAADQAVAESDKGAVKLHVDDAVYEFPRKRLFSPQFRRYMQKGLDAVGIEYLLGAQQFDAFLDATADEDGVTSDEDYAKLMEAVGEAMGVGNS